MIEMLITSARTVYPENAGVEVHLYGRTAEGEAEHIRVQEFEPYFYAPADDYDKLEPKDHKDLKRRERVEKESLFGDDLVKLVTHNPGGVGRLRDQYETTFEADVRFTNRLRIDHDIYSGVRVPQATVRPDEIEPVEVDAEIRYCYWDIEIDDRGPFPMDDGAVAHADAEIVTVCAYDSYLEEVHGFLNTGGRDIDGAVPETVETGELPEGIDVLHYSPTEKGMLKDFFGFVKNSDPDVMLAWNGDGFDTPYTIARAEEVNARPAEMGRYPAPEATSRYGGEVSGRSMYDLMEAWSSMQYSDVSSRLENAAQMELGTDEGKIKHEASIYEMWRDDCQTLLEYNAKDVTLMADINDAAGVMADREELKDIVGVDFSETLRANDFIEMLSRRMLDDMEQAGPTKDSVEYSDYKGARTFEAFEGRKRNLTSIDLASLYPESMKMLNSSPEKLIEQVDDPDPDDYEQDVTVAPNGAVFDNESDGLFRKLVDKALELTEAAGDRRDECDPSSDEWTYWNQVREARKRIRNGLYGVLGWEHFYLYSEPVAESITTIGRASITRAETHINENTEGTVVYGDTDSCYISWPDDWDITRCLVMTEQVAHDLNNTVYPEYAEEFGIPAEDCRWIMDMEDATEVMFMSGKKKRYAKNVVWKEGMDFDDRINKNKISGYECVRSDASPLLEELQEVVLSQLVQGASKSEIRESVYKAATEITRTGADFDRIGIPGGIGQALDAYDSPTAQVRAAKAANQLVDAEIQQGDKPMRVYIEQKSLEHGDECIRTDAIGFMDASDLEPVENQLYVDVPRMREVVIERPMSRILDCVGISTEAAMSGKRQGAITDWV